MRPKKVKVNSGPRKKKRKKKKPGKLRPLEEIPPCAPSQQHGTKTETGHYPCSLRRKLHKTWKKRAARTKREREGKRKEKKKKRREDSNSVAIQKKKNVHKHLHQKVQSRPRNGRHIAIANRPGGWWHFLIELHQALLCQGKRPEFYFAAFAARELSFDASRGKRKRGWVRG